MQHRFNLSETGRMHRTFVPRNVAETPPSLSPCRNFASGTKDVPPSRPYEHCAFVNVAIHKAFRASKKSGGVNKFMQRIIERNENISKIIVVRYVLTKGGARATCRDRTKSGHPFEAEIGPRQSERALLVGSSGLPAQSTLLLQYGLGDQESGVVRPDGHAIYAGQRVVNC